MKAANIQCTLLALVSSIALSACGSEPSAGDVKNSLKQMVKDCPAIEIKDVEKTNGRPGDNKNEYVVNVKYKSHYTPLKEIKEEEAILAEHRREVESQVESLKAEYDAAVAKHDAEYKAFRASGIQPYTPEWDAGQAKLDASQNAFREAQDRWQGALRSMAPDNVLAYQNLLNKVCQVPMKFHRVTGYIDFIQMKGSAQSGLVNEQELAFQGQFHMVKTENGWMIWDLVSR